MPGAKIGIGWLRCDEDGPAETRRRKGDEYYFGHHFWLLRNADHCFEVTLAREVLRASSAAGPR